MPEQPVETPDIPQVELPETLALLPMRDLVVFPFAIVPLMVSRAVSAAAVDLALGSTRDRLLFVTVQRAEGDDEPGPGTLNEVGTVATILKMRKLSDGRMRILVQGLFRARVTSWQSDEGCLVVQVEQVHDRQAGADKERGVQPDPHGPLATAELAALSRQIKDDLDVYARAGKVSSPELVAMLAGVDEPGRLSDLVSANLQLKVEEGQRLLEELDPLRRLRLIGSFLRREVEIIQMQQIIQSRAREVLSRSQREHYLREQLRQIHSELGGGEDGGEAQELRKRITDSGATGEALIEAERQLRRLETMQPATAEYQVVRTYLEWLGEVPWQKTTHDQLDLAQARRILDEDHYDLDRVKDRILEFLSVLRLQQKDPLGEGRGRAAGPVLCLVGPPGVGKTSLGRSVARALGRRFVRVVLGGVRDDAEIRGHRRTYVGALPGRLIQGMRTAGVKNPIILLDEIDKMGHDTQGDPAAALLEVLDPEQNHAFRDHYLGVPFDLSQVLFLATANAADRIPQALRDRLEIIHLSGYSEVEKLAIAQRHVVPRAILAAGLSRVCALRFTTPALRTLINDYTHEAGLRDLERQISAICRKIARQVVEREDEVRKTVSPVSAGLPALGGFLPVVPNRSRAEVITPKVVSRLLGAPMYHRGLNADTQAEREHAIGTALGLAWTPVGGEVLEVETQWMPGQGTLTLTGHLGEVMRESAQTALSFARAHAARIGHKESERLFGSREIHVHVPAGSVPKDGPSAGVTMACALLSLICGVPVRGAVAMTGEITLRGRVLPIGGLKEKLLAALRAGLSTVLIPRGNQRDLEEIPKLMLRGLRVVLVDDMTDVLREALLRPLPRMNPPRGRRTGRQKASHGVGRLRKA